MHEIGVVRSMVKTVTDFAQANGIAEVTEIVLDIGELSLVIPKYVEDIYPVVVEDTFLKDTKLIINVIPGMAECDECNELFNVIEHEGYCPNCGSFEKTILSGRCKIQQCANVTRGTHGFHRNLDTGHRQSPYP